MAALSWLNWNLEMFVQLWREENRRTRRKTLGARREPTTNSTHVRRRARTVGMVGDKHSLRCAIFASPCGYWVGRQREVRRFSQIKRAAENGLVRHESIIFFSSALQSFTQTRRTKEKRGALRNLFVWFRFSASDSH